MQLNNSNNIVWRNNSIGWVLFSAVFLLLGILYYDGLSELFYLWNTREEYSHGYLIPVISTLLIWQQKDKFEQIEFNGSWLGVVIVLLGIFTYLLGDLSTLFVIVHYSLLVVLTGLALSLTGYRGFVFLLVPLIYLAFMVPLPPFLYNNLSAKLQLISSELGVTVIRWFGISVFLEGNVIDLGTYKLQVVEACSGLRYLFPLMSIAFLCAYLFKQSMWKRVVLFLSSIPITVLMNSFRIGVIGVLVNNWGTGMAEGFLHDFEGWIVFMACLLVLFVEMWLLSKIGRQKISVSELFTIEMPSPTPEGATVRYRTVPKTFIVSGAILLFSAIGTQWLTERVEAKLERKSLVNFPVTINDWQGKPSRIDKIYLLSLDLSDYIISDYVNSQDNKQRVNFYVAYYDSQRKGESAHSPRSCIPGGGWVIQNLASHTVDNVFRKGKPMQVNRLQIQKGENKQLVYYWFQQRGRVINNEYMVKWYLFWDSLTRNRTDGALVRLTTQIPPGVDVAEGDRRLTSFLKSMGNTLDDFIPG